ncbi:HNH endonuclease family protein [Streptomyces sp. SBC-4]|nr:HNH endonuclease family protein [Streptomyces sp. SBC-4]MDV5146234.1 HNH endonuclease family protein [Streptomyces sp. SBC-4]
MTYRKTYRTTLTATALAVAALVAATACTPGSGTPASDGGGSGGKPAARGSALAAVDALTVKGRAPKTGYEREKFGRAWADVDGNGCGTRDDILRRDLSGVRLTDGRCKVASGTLADDPYTGTTVEYVRGRSKVDIDHVVALSDAWQKGAGKWDKDTRRRFANDPLNLLAVDSSTNRRKSDGDAATWLPPNKAYRCTYVARQVAVKKKYGVWVTGAERDAMKRVLKGCPQQKLP